MNTYNFLPEISNLVFLQQLLKSYGFLSNNGTCNCICFFVRKFISYIILAINFAALNNLLQMFANNMNLNGNKPPLLPPPPGTSSNMTLNSQTSGNQSLNIQEQQSHTLNSPRSHPSNPNNGTYNNETSLLVCGTSSYNSTGPSPNNGNGLPTNQNGSLTPSAAAPNNALYPSNIPSLYTNSSSSLSSGGAGKVAEKSLRTTSFCWKTRTKKLPMIGILNHDLQLLEYM